MDHILTNAYHEILRFDRGDQVIEKLLDFIKQRGIEMGWVFGLGACQEVTLAFYDLDKKEYQPKEFKELLEIVSIEGNVAVKDGSPILHLHGTFSRKDFSTIGGHLQKLVAAGTVEIFIHKVEGNMKREFDDKTGLNLLSK